MKTKTQVPSLKQLESLAEVKIRFLEIGKQKGFIYLADLWKAVSHMALTDQENDELLLFFQEQHIEIKEDIIEVAQEINLVDEDAEIVIPSDFPRVSHQMDNVKLRDPIKRYIHEIIQYPLLSKEEEFVLGQKMVAGEFSHHR